MKLIERLASLEALAGQMKDLSSVVWQDAVLQARIENPWFSEKYILGMLSAIRDEYLEASNIKNWLSKYEVIDGMVPKKIGMILAGNIPAVGWHDILSCYLAGHISVIKYSDKDKILIPLMVSKLIEIDPANVTYFTSVARLEGHDAVIATGSNLSASVFEQYFGKYPNIIRKNRNSIAVIHSSDGASQITALGEDIFTYFGLGCRNVSKIYLPQDYDITKILEVLHEFNEVVQHHKYFSNFEYNMALFMLNKQHYLNNGSIMMLEDKRIGSRIATLHYERYSTLEDLGSELQTLEDQIQCVVSSKSLDGIATILPGQAQKPALWDYADGVDTMDFLLGL